MLGFLRPRLLTILLLVCPGMVLRAGMTPVQLRCEYRENPLGVDSPHPRLTWNLQSDQRGALQTAYEILVASSPEQLARDQGDLWDSGQVQSDQSVHIVYAGKSVSSSQQIFWKVRVWGRDNQPVAWSKTATWTMGLLSEADWKAKWIAQGQDETVDKSIAGSLLLRREFLVKPALKRAVVNVCGLGQYEMFLNGSKVGLDLLSPGWTNYKKTVLYDTYDVTSMLKPGANAAGLALGNGMYNVVGERYTKFKGSFGPQKAIAQFRLEYADGSVETVVTDESWKVHAGPITFSSIYGGEDYDAREDQNGWKTTGFADTEWKPVVATQGPGGELKGTSSAAPPIRAFQTLKPVASKALTPGVTVYDLGQNTALMPRIIVKGKAGSSVKIIPSELIRDNGDIDDTMCGGNNWWSYTLKGEESEKWFPQFYYRGARYLKVEMKPAPGDANLPVVLAIEGVVIHSSSTAVGEFACSNDLFNRTHTLVRWAQLSNLVSVITDCPTREKLGWLEQYHLNGPSLRYAWDLAALYTKGLNDIHDSQIENGMVPTTAPEYSKFGGSFRDSPEWSSTLILAAWQQVEFDGDLDLVNRFYPDMQRYAAYLGAHAKGHILDFGLGDWYDIGPKSPGYAQLTPRALTATAIYFEDVRALGRMARLLKKPEDAVRYEAEAQEIRMAFNTKFFNPQTKEYATGSQCANAMPLVLDLVDPADRQAVLDNLAQDVQSKGLTAGDVGYRYLLRALANGGRSDVIYSMNNQSEKPGYGMQLARGATSLTEAWDALRRSSQNHFMLGQIMEWFYHDLAGIQSDPEGPGFQKIIIKPAIVEGLTWAKATYHSIRGDIISAWATSKDGLTMNLTIPAGTTATVYVPTGNPAQLKEGNRPVTAVPDIHFLRMEDGAAVYATGSGSYVFSSPYTSKAQVK